MFRASAKARRPTSPPPPLPEPLPLKQDERRPPFEEPPRLKAARRLKLPNMNVGQMLDGHRELRPDFTEIRGNFREEIKPLGRPRDVI